MTFIKILKNKKKNILKIIIIFFSCYLLNTFTLCEEEINKELFEQEENFEKKIKKYGIVCFILLVLILLFFNPFDIDLLNINSFDIEDSSSIDSDSDSKIEEKDTKICPRKAERNFRQAFHTGHLYPHDYADHCDPGCNCGDTGRIPINSKN